MEDRTLVDTSFFFALYDERDTHHKKIVGRERELQHCHFVLAWPVLYETINSRLEGLFQRKAHHAAHLSNLIQSRNATLLDDAPYRARALHNTIRVWEDNQIGEKVSLVDRVLHLIIEDTNVNLDSVLSTDARDFRRICKVRNERFELDYWT